MTALGAFSSGDVLTAADLNAIGTWTTYAPVLEQVVTFGLTVSSTRYARLNEIVFYQGHIRVSSGTGSAGNALELSLPLSYGAPGNGVIGNAWIFDSGSSTAYHAAAFYIGSDKVSFIGDWSGGNSFGAQPSIAVGFNDQVRFSIVYQTDA